MTRVLCYGLCMLLPALAAHADTDRGVDVEVQVRDASGAPVQGATVTCLPASYDLVRSGIPRPDEQKASDNEGRCTFGPYDAATQCVAYAQHEGLHAAQVFRTSGPGDAPAQVSLVLEPPQRHVQGKITDVTGSPISETRIIGWGTFPLATTDSDGRFTFRLPEGVRMLGTFVYKPDHAVMAWDMSRKASEYLITLPRGKPISGKVRMPDGSPAANMPVTHHHGVVYTGEAGRFETMPLAVGDARIRLIVHKDIEGGDLHTIARYDGLPEDAIELRLDKNMHPPRPPMRELHLSQPYYPHNSPGTMEVVRQADLSGMPEAVRVTGRAVHATSGEGVQGTVHLSRSSELRGHIPKPLAESDAEGKFAFHVRRSDELYLLFLPYAPVLYAAPNLIGVDFDAVEAGEAITVPVKTGCAIHGKLVNEAGEPVSRRWVFVSPAPDDVDQFLTRHDGTFRLDHLANPNTRYTLRVRGGTGPEPAAETTIGPLNRGEIAKGITLRVPNAPNATNATASQATVRGVVVDKSGDPVEGALVVLRAGPREVAEGLTDAEGRFEIISEKSGMLHVEVLRRMTLSFPGKSEHIEHAYRRVDGPRALNLAERETREELRYVVSKQPEQPPIVRVLDENDEPIHGSVNTVYGERPDRHAHRHISHGVYVVPEVPAERFLLEAIASGYQAKVLEPGRDFQAGERQLVIRLEAGPFPEDISVFIAVTGRPATQEQVDTMPHGDYVHRRVRDYFKIASEERPQKANRGKPVPAKQTWRLRVTRADGKPVKQLYFQRSRHIRPDDTAAFPVPDDPEMTIMGNDGIFRMSDGTGAVWTDGTAAAAYHLLDQEPDEPVDVELPEACTLEVRVRNPSGNPVQGLTAVPAHIAALGDIAAFPKTGPDGSACLSPLPPGTRVFRLFEEHDTRPRAVAQFRATLRPDAATVVEHRYGEPEPGTPHATLKRLEEQSERGELPSDALAALSNEERKPLRKTVVEEINRQPDTTDRYKLERLQFLAALAMQLDSPGAPKALKTYLRRVHIDEDSSRLDVITTARQFLRILEHVIAMEPKQPVPFLSKLAQKDQTAPPLRIAALVELGQIGTLESIEAYVKLRDAAYDAPLAPEPKENYTHAERMAEALYMTTVIIPFQGRDLPDPPELPSPYEAWVGEDYQTGHMDARLFTRGHGQTTFELKRFGGEWVVTAIGGTVVY